ncbi:hypothetical protein [Butyricimonas virosa]
MADKLYNKDLNISEDDVLICDDIEQLYAWEKELMVQLRDIKSRLEQYDELKKLNPELVTDDKYIKTYDAKKYRLQFLDLIIERIKILKRKDNKDKLLMRKFMSAAKDFLKPDVYKAILEEAKKRAKY